jgi:hypothetical protein
MKITSPTPYYAPKKCISQANYIELMLIAYKSIKRTTNKLAHFVLYLYIYVLQYIYNKSYTNIFFYKKNIDRYKYISEYTTEVEGYSYV